MKAAAQQHMPRLDSEYESAIERYKQSLAIKADFYEAAIAWGQQAFEAGPSTHPLSSQHKPFCVRMFCQSMPLSLKTSTLRYARARRCGH
jgi:hypothetical protein